jgi:hypothetical protein
MCRFNIRAPIPPAVLRLTSKLGQCFRALEEPAKRVVLIMMGFMAVTYVVGYLGTGGRLMWWEPDYASVVRESGDMGNIADLHRARLNHSISKR